MTAKNTINKVDVSGLADSHIFSLKCFIAECADKKEISADDEILLRRFLRKAEISNELFCDYYVGSFKPVSKECFLDKEDVDAFLSLILRCFEQNQDLKILNGFLKVALGSIKTHQGDAYRASPKLLELAKKYNEEVRICENG